MHSPQLPSDAGLADTVRDDQVLEHVQYENRVTNYLDIGPVNTVLNTFVLFFRDPESEEFLRSLAGCDEYIWTGHDGTKMQS